MRVGLLVDLRNPPGWRREWVSHYRRTLEFIEEADRLGIDVVKLSEHHLFEDGLLSQPLTIAAAVAVRTSKIRIMAGVLAPLTNPQAVAEQAAIVDVLSNGRLELALGAGYRVPEFRAFGVDFDNRFKALVGTVDAIRSIWASRTSLPTPVQQPLPLWLMADSQIGARRAGRLGGGLLSQKPELYKPYLEGLAAAGLGADAARVDGLIRMTFAEDPSLVWPVFKQYLSYREDTINAARVEGTDQSSPQPVVEMGFGVSEDVGTALKSQLVTPELGAAEILQNVNGRQIVGVHFFLSIAGMPDSLVAENLRLIATRVRPLLQTDMEQVTRNVGVGS